MTLPENGIRIRQIDESLFTRSYHGRCLDFSCNDECCTYGCDVDIVERDRILSWASLLEAKMGIPSSKWFREAVMKDDDYPSGKVVRTRIRNGKCIFHNRRARGCILHSFAVEQGRDWRFLKPMVCVMFPVNWTEGRLETSPFLDELPCRDVGSCVFENQKEEIAAVFGDDLAFNLEQMARNRANIDKQNLQLIGGQTSAQNPECKRPGF